MQIIKRDRNANENQVNVVLVITWLLCRPITDDWFLGNFLNKLYKYVDYEITIKNKQQNY